MGGIAPESHGDNFRFWKALTMYEVVTSPYSPQRLPYPEAGLQGSYFSWCYGKIPAKTQPTGARIYPTAFLGGTVPPWWGMTKWLITVAAGAFSRPQTRKHKDVCAITQLPFSFPPFLLSLGPWPIEWCHPDSGWVLPPQFPSVETPSQTCSEVCLVGDS